MPRICALRKTKTMFGNNKSHSNRKTRRTFVVNLHKYTFVDAKGVKTSLRLSKKGVKTIEKSHLNS